MYYFVTASKDSTIYLQQPTQNTGLDEILEIRKDQKATPSTAEKVRASLKTALGLCSRTK